MVVDSITATVVSGALGVCPYEGCMEKAVPTASEEDELENELVIAPEVFDSVGLDKEGTVFVSAAEAVDIEEPAAVAPDGVKSDCVLIDTTSKGVELDGMTVI